jgi:hypothetical protein
MPHSLKDLLQQTESLREVLPDLGKQLGKAARRLELSGCPVPDNLLKGTTDYHEDLLDLFARGLSCAEASKFTHLPKTGEIASFVDLESFLDTLLEAKSEVMVLERVQAIAHCDNIELPSLQECQAKARELILEVLSSEWSAVSSAIKSLADQKSPYSGLLKIIEERENLNDTEWASIQEELSESFGKDLAVAASREKLTLRSQEAAAETPPQIVMEETAQQPEEQRVSKQKIKGPEPEEQEHQRHHLTGGLSLLIRPYQLKGQDALEASVTKVSLDEIWLNLEKQPEHTPFEIGERVKLEYWVECGMCYSDAEVLENLGRQDIRVALSSLESAYRRKFTRVPLKIPFVYSTLTDTSEDSDVSQEVVKAQTEDFSVGGLKFSASFPLTKGERLQLGLRFSPSQTVKTDAVVVRSETSKRGEKDLYSVGVEFLELKSQEKELIRRFLAHGNGKETSAEPAETTSILEVLRHPVRRSQVRR